MHLSALFEYPVKSCQSRVIDKAQVTEEGFVNDRRYLFVSPKGRFVTQRELPKMVNIKATLADNELVFNIDNEEQRFAIDNFSVEREVTIWNDRVLAKQSQQHPSLVADYLGMELALVVLPERNRPIPSRSAEGFVSFADGLPYLLTTTASLDDLNSRLDKPVSMLNFRPNLVVTNDQAYAEDHWHRLKIGEVIFRAVKPCSRCIMTTVDINSGEAATDMEPLKTLAGYRMVPNEGVMFGMNLVAENNGWVHLQDPVELLD